MGTQPTTPEEPSAEATTSGRAGQRYDGTSPPRDQSTLTSVVVAMRPHEWVKNGFVLAPLVFAGRADVASALIRTVETFVAFCLVAGAGYLVNDVRDVELDRRHPTKRQRPIAAGELRPRSAIAAAAAAYAVGFGIAAVAGWKVLALVAAYVVLTIAYSLWLKNVVIIDVMTIAAGFIIRVQAGLVAAEAPGSELLLLTTGMLAVLLALTKRRQEAISAAHDGPDSRPVLRHYSLPFLDQMIALSAAGTLMAYVVNSVSSKFVGGQILPTVVPVFYGILRFLYLIYDRRDTRSTAAMLASDPGVIGAGVVWIAMAAAIVYF